MLHATPPERIPLLLIGGDAASLEPLAAALAQVRAVAVTVLAEPIEQVSATADLEGVAAVLVDLESRRRESLVALQGLMARLAGRAPVVVLTDAFDDALARWFLQIRVADFLRKPVSPSEVLRACVQALRAGDAPSSGGRIHAFLPAAGGVGTTTLAIETAMLLQREHKDSRCCLVDLDFRAGSCADYLDLEPRLSPDEVAHHPERLDQQLLEVMLSRHRSGVAVLAARGRPAEPPSVPAAFVLRMLDLVAARFDHVVVDMPLGFDPWTEHVLVGADHLRIVTDMTVPGLRHARRLAEALVERLPEIDPKVIVNRFQQTLLFGTGLRRADLERALERFFAGTVANNYPLVREAIDRGLALDEVKAGSNVSADLRRLVVTSAQADLARAR